MVWLVSVAITVLFLMVFRIFWKRISGDASIVRKILPRPQGLWQVSIADLITPGLGRSGMFVRLYYPVDLKEDVALQSLPTWMPNEKMYVRGYSLFTGLKMPLMKVVFKLCMGTWYLPTFRNRSVTQDLTSLPLMIFSHGTGMCRSGYSIFCTEMASRGFMVVAIEHRDGSACMTLQLKNQEQPGLVWMPYRTLGKRQKEYFLRHEQLEIRTIEIENCWNFCEKLNMGMIGDVEIMSGNGEMFISNDNAKKFLCEMKGKLDLSRASLVGHSFGGTTVLSTLAQSFGEAKFRCGVALDCWMFPIKNDGAMLSAIKKPILFINMEEFQTRPNLKTMQYCLQSQTPHRVLTLEGTIHANQCDTPFMADFSSLSRFASHHLFGPASKLHYRTAMELNNHLVLQFLTHMLDLPRGEDSDEFVKRHRNVLKEGIVLPPDPKTQSK